MGTCDFCTIFSVSEYIQWKYRLIPGVGQGEEEEENRERMHGSLLAKFTLKEGFVDLNGFTAVRLHKTV